MKILVGILYSIENEFDACIQAIQKQRYTDYEYFIISGLPNKEAHDTLYKSFMDRAGEFDLFIKIDADMVLLKDNFFDKVVEIFKHRQDLGLLKTRLWDFYTDSEIGSLNIYRSNVKWDIHRGEDIFPDRTDDSLVQEDEHNGLSPVALHCPNPSEFQSFHFGVHKAVKVMQFGKKEKNYGASCEHWNNYIQTLLHYRRTRDNRLAYAVLGAEMAFRRRFSAEEINYSNPRLNKCFERYRKMPEKEIFKDINRLNFRTYNYLPGKWRQDMLFRVRSRHFLAPANFNVLVYLLKMIHYTLKTGRKVKE